VISIGCSIQFQKMQSRQQPAEPTSSSESTFEHPLPNTPYICSVCNHLSSNTCKDSLTHLKELYYLSFRLRAQFCAFFYFLLVFLYIEKIHLPDDSII